MIGNEKWVPKDIQILGSETRYLVVRANNTDVRGWLQQGAVSPLLEQHHIAHVGIMDAVSPFEVSRTDLSGTFMLACISGEGVVLADGKWKRIRAGQACLQPPFAQNCLKCVAGKRWEFAWVRYQETRESVPIVSSRSPVSREFDPTALSLAIRGLNVESLASKNAAMLYHWTELIHRYVLEFAEPDAPDKRLWKVWQRVEGDLRHPWTLVELAGIACMSEEHLRRVCRKEIGRSPMQHVTFLRLQKAVQLLSVTDDKVESIAYDVGFDSASTFSNTFKKWIGWRPSEQRR